MSFPATTAESVTPTTHTSSDRPACFARATGTAPIPVQSGRTDRHRLDRGGNRQLNLAIHTIALTQARKSPEARAYIARLRASGKTWREAVRCLKRHITRRVYNLLMHIHNTNSNAPAMTAALT